MIRRIIGLAIMLAAFAFAAMRAPDRALESLVPRWAPPPSEFIELGEQLVHLRDEGPRDDPQPIVLLHGTSASLHTWEGWVAELKQTRRVISFDLPGFGLTGPAASGDYSDAAYIAFLEALLKRLKIERAVLGGNSLGGQIAWEYALSHRAQVAGLILVDAGGYAFKPESMPQGFQIARMPAVAWLGRHVLPRRVVENSVLNVYGDPARVKSAVVDRYFELTLREGNREALGRRIKALRPGAYASQLSTLKGLPTLILWGERDRLIPLEYGRDFARDIPGSQLVSFPTLGHVPQEEDPKATLAPVQGFLRGLPR